MKRDPRPSGIFDTYHVEVEKYLEQNHYRDFLEAAQERMLNKKFTIVYRAHPPTRPKSMGVQPVVKDSSGTTKERAKNTSDKTGSSSRSLEESGLPPPKNEDFSMKMAAEKSI